MPPPPVCVSWSAPVVSIGNFFVLMQCCYVWPSVQTSFESLHFSLGSSSRSLHLDPPLAVFTWILLSQSSLGSSSRSLHLDPPLAIFTWILLSQSSLGSSSHNLHLDPPLTIFTWILLSQSSLGSSSRNLHLDPPFVVLIRILLFLILLLRILFYSPNRIIWQANSLAFFPLPADSCVSCSPAVNASTGTALVHLPILIVSM